MKHLDFNKTAFEALILLILVFGSALSLADEYFQDAVFEELQSVGVDTAAFRSKLKEGDFSGAKNLLEDEKSKTSISEVEEEVATLLARKVLHRVRNGKEPKNEGQKETIYQDDASADSVGVREIPVEKVVLDEEDDRKTTAQLRSQVSSFAAIPGQEVNPFQGYPKALNTDSEDKKTALPPMRFQQETRSHKEDLQKIGVRELQPGTSIFRFLKLQVRIWARENQAAKR